MNNDLARFNMIEQQIRPWDVLDGQVLSLLSVVKREDFVPMAHKALAFVDMEIPLAAGQTMLAPKVQARLLHDLAVQGHEKVLEIGAGSGYLTALLARRAQHVTSLEIHEELVRTARANLQQAGIRNADVKQADGASYTAPDGPFDVILLTGSVAEVPRSLLNQLKVGGRLAAIVGEDPVMHATLVTRVGASEYRTRQLWESSAQALLNFARPSRFTF